MIYKPTSETLAIVERLGGRWHRHHAMAACPAHDDGTPSLSLRQGHTSVLVHCFAGCNAADVMSAIRQRLGRAIRSLEPSSEQRPLLTGAWSRIWDNAQEIAGTLGERYLRDIRKIQFLPPDVRFHPRCPKGKGRDTVFEPALIVGIFRHGQIRAVQRLFLDSVTAQRTERMILGDSRGGTWPRRHPGMVMRVAEGFETACAYTQITGLRAAACFGDRNFAVFQAAAHVQEVVLLPDNHPRRAITLAEQAAQVRRSGGMKTSFHLCPPQFDDWATILTASPVQTVQAG